MEEQWGPDNEDGSWEGVWQAGTDQVLSWHCDDDDDSGDADDDGDDSDDRDDDDDEQSFVTWAGPGREKEADEREIVGKTMSLDF